MLAFSHTIAHLKNTFLENPNAPASIIAQQLQRCIMQRENRFVLLTVLLCKVSCNGTISTQPLVIKFKGWKNTKLSLCVHVGEEER